MYISELELQGFKSFAYKTKVKFDSGITAIVGPNGCGKSNIVDSLRWVLGEQRPTLLRSSAMTNVIFNGTAQKNALGLAEVSLTFINNKGLLPTEYSEVTITRRLYRSGDSEYLINNSQCRLKDIMELFMDTGMGSNAYSVIELKMVEEILQDKQNDRRKLFEEAAGVTKYKEKRKKTFRKLEETRNDLQRVEDLLVEVRKKTRSLQLQASKARKAKEYEKELTQLDQAVHLAEYEAVAEELEPLEERIGNAEKEKKEIVNKVEQLEESEQSVRSRLGEKERHQADAQRRVNQLAGKIREHETTLRITREKITNEQNVIDQYGKDIEQAEQDLADLREVFKHNQDQLEKYDKELKRAEKNLNESQERYKEIQQEYNGLREELDRTGREFNKSNDELNRLQNERVKIESKLENTEGDLTRIQEEMTDLEDEIENLKGEKGLLAKKLEAAQEERDEAEETLEQARERREELADKQNELKDYLRTQQSRYDALSSEIKLLQGIAASNEAFPSSVQYLLEEHGGRFPLLDVVTNVLSTDQRHAVALESVLGDACNYVVVRTLDDAKEATRLLREADKGRATFIPLDKLSGDYAVEDGALYHQVECKNEFEALRKLLLGTVFTFESVEGAVEQLRQPGHTGVTYDGEVVTGHRFLHGGSTGQNVGMRVGLKDKIENLEQQAEKVHHKIDSARRELQEATEAYEKLNPGELAEALKGKEREVRQIENKINTYNSQIDIYQKNIGELNNRMEQLEASEGTARRQLDEMHPRQKELQNAIRELHKQQQEYKKKLAELEEERSIAQNRYNDAQLSHQDLRNKVENAEREIKRAESGIQSVKNRLKARAEKNRDSKEKIGRHKEQIETLNEELKAFREQKKEADAALEEAEEACARQRGRINEIEEELKDVRRRKEVNMELSHHLTMAKNKFEMQAKNLSDHIWETYGILMDQIEARLPEDQELDEAKERVGFLRQKLRNIGEVNPLAIEEYEEEKERLDFYETQIEDLAEAEEQLRLTIDEINRTATERFNVTFEQIRENFKNVFHTLFHEDDNCDLVIEKDVEDPLEAKIDIVANPKGKRPTNINQLSGGEKTLTAIALLFAIYLVKPSPFCVLDEVDAPLDDANIERFAKMIKRFSVNTQFIIITHNKKTMAKAEMMYGVTMPETGVSRLVAVKLDDVTD